MYYVAIKIVYDTIKYIHIAYLLFIRFQMKSIRTKREFLTLIKCVELRNSRKKN